VNLFFRELKSYRRGLLFWSLGIIALIGSSLAKFSTISGPDQSVAKLVAQFPQSIQTIFGLNGFDLSNASGYYGVIFMYLALMATIHAVLLGSGIISKEERDRTSEFLFVKPLLRSRAITIKILAGLFILLVFNLVSFASSVYLVDYFAKGSSILSEIILFSAGLFCLQVVFFFVGTTVAAVNKRPKTSGSIAAGVLLFTFILTYFININASLGFLKYLTPFKYFDAKDMIASGTLGMLNMLISLSLVAIMTFVTYKTYEKRDLNI